MHEFNKDFKRLKEILGHKNNWKLHIPALRKLVNNFNNKHSEIPHIDIFVWSLNKMINGIS